eukprot:jgi/Chlat1/6517/Chrsp45S05995
MIVVYSAAQWHCRDTLEVDGGVAGVAGGGGGGGGLVRESGAMRLVTWNINGLRAVARKVGGVGNLLVSLDADIVCFQEAKVSSQELDRELAIVDGYDAFFSFCTAKRIASGYSGTATYCRTGSPRETSSALLPIAAEQGVTGVLHHKGITGVKQDGTIGHWETVAECFATSELQELDSEGRCVVTDHGHFVLFNVYGVCTHGDDLERVQFKLRYFQALQKRCEALLAAGRNVMVVGDLNVAPRPIDHCDPGPDHELGPSRRWLNALLTPPAGPFTDVFRQFHPNREGAYTCWSVASGAKTFNYGTRIDLILAAGSDVHPDAPQSTGEGVRDALHGFAQTWFQACNITSDRNESDHAPVFADMLPLPPIAVHCAPSLCAKYRPSFAARQGRLTDMFFKSPKLSSQPTERLPIQTTTQAVASHKRQAREAPASAPTAIALADSDAGTNAAVGAGGPSGQVKVTAQRSLQCFFGRRSASVSVSSTTCSNKQEDSPAQVVNAETTACASPATTAQEPQSEAAAAWQRIQQRMVMPKCYHNEPCVSRVVKKAGPTCGRSFFVCARAQGPKTNPEARCDYFAWAATSTGKRKADTAFRHDSNLQPSM